MDAYIGTSGYSYPEWKGSFYPAKMAAKAMLSHYATRLASVEINNTFYRMPRPSLLQSWAQQVGSDFRFAVKASRRITHFKKLRQTQELVDYLAQGLGSLGHALGPVLFQLPPTLRCDLELLRDFLASLPGHIVPQVPDPEVTIPAGGSGVDDSGAHVPGRSTVPFLSAFEFRHPSWFDDAVFSALEDAGVALVGGDLDEPEKSPPFVATAPFLYLRLRRSDYQERELDTWAERIQSSGAQQVFGYFKHEVLGPGLAGKLASRLAGSPSRSPR